MTLKAYGWYGGKIRVVHELNFLIPKHDAYYEPFMGSASLLLNHPRSSLEVINDLDPELVHFMRTLADKEKGAILVERLCSLWYGRYVFEEALACKRKKYTGLDSIEKAAMVYILITQSYNCTRKAFAKGRFEDTQAYRNDIYFHIPKVHERLKDVRILNMDGIDLLSKISGNPNAFAFTDPPYRKELRGRGADKAYACELPHHEQIRLLKTIRNAKCKIILCGYRSENGADLYDNYLMPYGWKCYKLKELLKACQNSKKKDMGHEFIWVNYELPEHAKFVISMKEYGTAL